MAVCETMAYPTYTIVLTFVKLCSRYRVAFMWVMCRARLVRNQRWTFACRRTYGQTTKKQKKTRKRNEHRTQTYIQDRLPHATFFLWNRARRFQYASHCLLAHADSFRQRAKLNVRARLCCFLGKLTKQKEARRGCVLTRVQGCIARQGLLPQHVVRPRNQDHRRSLGAYGLPLHVGSR